MEEIILAGLTKEQRDAKQAENQKKLEDKIRVDLEKEYQQKLDEEKKKLKSSVKIVTKESQATSKVDIPSNLLIPVKSGLHGILTYSSKKTFGYTVDWDDYGSIEFMEYGELLSMRNTQKAFFENNWIFIEDTDGYAAEDVYKALAVDKYYNSVIVGEDLERLFLMDPNDIEETVSKLSSGIKQNIASIAKERIGTGEFDSNNRIKALEKALGLEFSASF